MLQTAGQTPKSLIVSGLQYQAKGDNPFSLNINRFEMDSGERVLLVGPSGSGKSTFLNLVTGVLAPKAGAIFIKGRNLVDLTSSQRDALRGEMFGIIFQTLNLLPYATVRQNIQLGMQFSNRRKQTVGGNLVATIDDLLRQLGLPQDMQSRKASQLSVGQQQRVAMSRALIGAPDIIIADEPTSALDRAHRDEFMNVLSQSIENTTQSVLMVSHDEALAKHFDRTITIQDLASPNADQETI